MRGPPLGPQPRIIDGTVVDDPAATATFFIRAGYDGHDETPDYLCGGSIIHDDIVVTSAHCFGSFHHGVFVFDATTNDFTRPVLVDHQVWPIDFDPSGATFNNDVMLLRLTESVIEASNFTIRPLPINKDDDVPIIGQQLNTYGFGTTEQSLVSATLKQGQFVYISNDVCTARLDGYVNAPQIFDDMLCVDPSERSSVCSGDSGGPLTDTDGATLMGVVSFSAQCRPDSIPDGYARISSFAMWIEDQICRYSKFPPITCETSLLMHSSSTYTMLNPPGAVKVQITFVYDFFPEQIQFRIFDNQQQVVIHAGPNYIAARESAWGSTIYLTPGNYTFEVFDKTDDGLRGSVYENSTFSCGWTITALYSYDDDLYNKDSSPNNNIIDAMEISTYGINNGEGDFETVLATGDPRFGSHQVTEFVVMDLSEERCLQQKQSVDFELSSQNISCDCERGESMTSQASLICRNTNDDSICSIESGVCGTSVEEDTIKCCGEYLCIDERCHKYVDVIPARTQRSESRIGQLRGGGV